MYDKTVTVFNHYDSITGRIWYPHVLEGVDLITDKSEIIRKYGSDTGDAAKLHVSIVPDSVCLDGGSFLDWNDESKVDGGVMGPWERGNNVDAGSFNPWDYGNMNNGSIILKTATGYIEWLPPKSWANQVNDNLEKTITFAEGDFFILGSYSENVVYDDEYADRRFEGFYAYMNAKNDYVYMITSVGGPYFMIPHFEIMGK